MEIVEGEHVVARGTATTYWFVRIRDGWTRAASVPGARIEPLSAGPGVVWQHRIELELERGARLLCVRSAPRPVTRQPLDYLQSSTSTKRRVVRSYHRVSRGGLIVGDPADKS